MLVYSFITFHTSCEKQRLLSFPLHKASAPKVKGETPPRDQAGSSRGTRDPLRPPSPPTAPTTGTVCPTSASARSPGPAHRRSGGPARARAPLPLRAAAAGSRWKNRPGSPWPRAAGGPRKPATWHRAFPRLAPPGHWQVSRLGRYTGSHRPPARAPFSSLLGSGEKLNGTQLLELPHHWVPTSMNEKRESCPHCDQRTPESSPRIPSDAPARPQTHQLWQVRSSRWPPHRSTHPGVPPRGGSRGRRHGPSGQREGRG